MLLWFREIAPIKLKLRVYSALNIFCVAASSFAAWSSGAFSWTNAAWVIGLTSAAIAINAVLSRAIIHPYVTTVIRMEALADGDLDSPVQFTRYRDCIGRMTTAMAKFRAAAQERNQLVKEAGQARAKIEAEMADMYKGQADAAQRQAQVIETIASGLAKFAAGDLTYRLNETFPPEYERLRKDFNLAVEQLQSALKKVVVAADNLRSGTEEIGQSAYDLSKRTEQQAASLEQTAAALDQITAAVRKTAEGAAQANHAVSSARAEATESGKVVGRAVAAMGEIESSAKQISQIIGVIDEIAFQTNLLALNAGVEAARAGDAGRGFAVVASEVRALAQRSAGAAKEIKVLISSSGRQVDQGVTFVGDAGRALERIAGQVAEISNLVTEIAASAREQASGLQDVNSAVNRMDQTTQQNAAMVEESTAASQALAQATTELTRLVGCFKVGDETSIAASLAAVRPANLRTRSIPQAKLRAVGGRRDEIVTENVSSDDGWEEF